MASGSMQPRDYKLSTSSSISSLYAGGLDADVQLGIEQSENSAEWYSHTLFTDSYSACIP